MSCGILYLLVGSGYGVRLTASLTSLRQFWRQPVCILCGDDAADEQAAKLMNDCAMHPLSIVSFNQTHKRNGCYQTKACSMWKLSPFESTLYVDADTIFTGKPFDELWPKDPREIVLTPFGNWISTGRTVSGRIKRWNHIRPDLVEKQLAEDRPAINTGVMGFTRKTEVLPFWAGLCLEQEKRDGRVTFIADEIAMQIAYAEYPHRLLSDAYNRSPIYGYSPPEDTVIWHCHGKKHLTSPLGREVMRRAVQAAFDDNIGMIRDWGLKTDPDTCALLDSEK